MDANNGYCSAQLKQAKNLARDGYYDSSIVAVGKGLERLLQELFSELRDTDKRYLFALSEEYLEATNKKKWSISKNGHRELNLYGWIKFYESAKLFSKLEETCGYVFDEFNRDNLHRIRIDRNKFGAHADERYEIHRELSSTLIDLYSKMLSEAGRIAQPTAIVPFNLLRRNKNSQIALYRNEKSLLKQEFDDVLRDSPDDTDFLFFRAYLMRGENAALDDLQRILILNPEHYEARKERIWNLNRRVSEEPASDQSSPNLTQVNFAYQRNYKFIQVSSTIRNFLPNAKILSNVNILSRINFSFKPNISIFRVNISETATRHVRDALITYALVLGVVLVVVVVGAVVGVKILAELSLAVIDVLKQSPHLLGFIVVVVAIMLLWWLIRR